MNPDFTTFWGEYLEICSKHRSKGQIVKGLEHQKDFQISLVGNGWAGRRGLSEKHSKELSHLIVVLPQYKQAHKCKLISLTTVNCLPSLS